MKCKPSDIPPEEEIDIASLKQKYRDEREVRLRPEGQAQYINFKDAFAEDYIHDPHTPCVERDPISENLNVAILGAGWSGLLVAYHLRNAGVTDFRNIDHAGNWGGVWYWNRFPGLQCDNDAYCYLPLLEETGFMPSKKYADGCEILDYFKLVVDKFGLHGNALFHTLITSLKWDEEIERWRIGTHRGDDIRARFVVMANGLLNIPKLPEIPGIHSFKGKMFHTSRWDYDYTGGTNRTPILENLTDKRVAIVGTGATSVQVIPHLSRFCEQLYVLQRTPSLVDQRNNHATDPKWIKSLKPGWQKARQANFQRGAIDGFQEYEQDFVCDFFTEINRNLAFELQAENWPRLSYEEYMKRREKMDYRVMERMRRRVESIVRDSQTAGALKPWFRFMCKRPLSNEDYYDTFNRPNVKLVDVSRTRGVEFITESGFINHGIEYDIDCIIFASGFEVSSGLNRRWGIDVFEGRDGLSIYDNWAKGYKTFHGVMSHKFPNLFFTGYSQGGLNATTTEQFNRQGFHITYIINETLKRGFNMIEPSKEAQDAYIRLIRDTAIDRSEFISQCTPGYYTNEGEKIVNENGEYQYSWYLGEIYGPGWEAFEKLLREWRERGDLAGLIHTPN